jgi:thiosulfate dehydrogenase (quinone) large subunit
MKANLSVKIPGWSGWVIVPLRLFMGLTFVYAGIQKLTDPQYFNPAARGYIGRQITAFATGSPLHGFLINVGAPHAMLFGALVALGELAIGLGVLLGFLLRPASLFGLLINLLFFLSADWHIFPYFYGSDIIFVFGWLTLLLAGPANQVLPALDTWIVIFLVERAATQNQLRRARVCEVLFGVKVGPAEYLQEQVQQTRQQTASAPATSRNAQPGQRQQAQQQSTSRYKAWQLQQARQQGRRNFIWGALTGGAVMLALAWVASTLHLLPGSANASDTNPGSSTLPQDTPAPGVTPTPSNPGTSGTIAKISDVPTNSSFSFTLPSSGDPGILIHLNNGQFVAYDAACTHAGCPVDYDPSSQELICPCHGATFDPSQSAAVINGPAQTPLISVKIKVDQNAGTVSLSQ